MLTRCGPLDRKACATTRFVENHERGEKKQREFGFIHKNTIFMQKNEYLA